MTAGSVDDGKSTLIGRMLHDAGALCLDQVEAIRKKARLAGGALDFSLVTDGLLAEREQGITIDVAYRYFETAKRRFIVADAPGHEQYTRNMATGASTADLAVILIDARQGVVTQSKRHGFIASLLGVRRIAVAVNKMDLVGFDETVFARICDEYSTFARRLDFTEFAFIPTCAVEGDNLAVRSERTPWYDGPTLLGYLERVYVGGDANLIDFRFPVQRVVLRAADRFRGYSGTVASGVVRPGDEVAALLSGRRTRVARIVSYGGDLPYAHAPQSVTLTLDAEIDVSRGDMLAHPCNIPRAVRSLEAMLLWMGDRPLAPGLCYFVKQTTRTVKASCTAISYRVDPNSLRRESAVELRLNDIGRVELTLFQPLHVDDYSRNRATGSFILIDQQDNATVGAGMVISRQRSDEEAGEHPVSRHINPETGQVAAAERAALLGQRPLTVWLTGLSASGKSTLSQAVERQLVTAGRLCCVLDGDNVRRGLNRDLGFSPEHRRENIRRIAEVARLMNDAGLIVITAFISPYREDREDARRIVGEESFLEVYLSTDLETCEARDPKGLYGRARSGEIAEFTAVSAPYEPPTSPHLVINTAVTDVDGSAQLLLDAIATRLAANP